MGSGSNGQCSCRWLRRGATLTLALLVGVFAALPAAAQLPVPTDCQVDVQGANDQPGQKDLTLFCVEGGDNGPYELHTLWNWDEVLLPGGNTNDACTLYDTDGDLFANLAVCVTTEDGGGPPHLPIDRQGVRLFTCNDSSTTTCAGKSTGSWSSTASGG